MGMPHEGSIFCEGCSAYNIQSSTCIIIDGDGYCESCIERKGFKKVFDKLVHNLNQEETN